VIFGIDLSDTEKTELIEYPKTLQDLPTCQETDQRG
jgi:hypothetical protein